jgi:phage recombination protein Bet
LTAFNKGTVETVKRTVFPGATDDELRLYFWKCQQTGAHPLSGMIIPAKFNDATGPGGKRVVFITKIDYLRSRSEDAGDYAGMDEPEYEDEFDLPNGKKAPGLCRVKVYKTGIARPFVGVARWSEFLPGQESKQFQWKQMPHVMLAKCAEAQARRLAWPEKLFALYEESEMEQAAESTAKVSSKPQVRQPTLKNLPAPEPRSAKEPENAPEVEAEPFDAAKETDSFLTKIAAAETVKELAQVSGDAYTMQAKFSADQWAAIITAGKARKAELGKAK